MVIKWKGVHRTYKMSELNILISPSTHALVQNEEGEILTLEDGQILVSEITSKYHIYGFINVHK